MPDRTFNEEEVAALFKRASELQSAEVRDNAASRPSLTLEEAMGVAAEAGLDPEHVRRAAAELQLASDTNAISGSRVRGKVVLTERLVPHAVASETIEDIIADLRHWYDTSAGEQMGMPGYGKSTTETVGRSIEWKHTDLWGIETRVLLQPRDDHLRVRASRRTDWGDGGNWQSMAGVVALFVGFLAAPAFGSYLVGLAAGIAALLVLYPVMGRLNTYWVKKQGRKVEELADSIVEQAIRLGPPNVASGLSKAAQPFNQKAGHEIDVPEEHGERGHTEEPGRRRTG